MSIQTRQQLFIENFEIFDDWSDKYSYLISLGKELDPFPKNKQCHKYMMKGCQSQVWFDFEARSNKLFFYGMSDAAIVCGLIRLLLKVYSGSSANEIINSDISFLSQIGLLKHLSLTRNNGLHAMINYMYKVAQDYANKEKD